jgi:hypothetical protein
MTGIMVLPAQLVPAGKRQGPTRLARRASDPALFPSYPDASVELELPRRAP